MGKLIDKALSGLDGVQLLLFFGVLLYSLILIWIQYRFANDSSLFQTVNSVLISFSTAFFARMNPTKPESKQHDSDPSSSKEGK